MPIRPGSFLIVRQWVLVLALAFVASCGENNNDTSEENSNTLTILVPGGDERIIGPAWDDNPKQLVFMHLVTYDYYWCADAPTGGLAERLVPNSDQTEWMVYLRPDIRWHDGVPVTAHDIKFTVDLWNHPDVNYYAGEGFGELTVIDDYTFHIKYDRPRRDLFGGWDVFYPRHLLKDLPAAEFMNWEFWSRPVGNGPYRYVRHTRKTMMEFEANPDFYLGEPRIKKLILKFGAEGASGIAELKGGAVDVLGNISAIDALAIQEDDQLKSHFRYIPSRVQISWNHRNPLFSDARVRRALTHAMDRRALHAALNLPPNLPLTDGLYTTCQFRRGEFPTPLSYDLSLARALMAEAGWTAGEDRMLHDGAGNPFRFTLLTGENLHAQAAVLVQSQLRDLGVDMKIQPLQYSSIRESVNNSDFEAALHDLGASMSFHHQPFFSGNSPLGYQNDKVDAIYAGLTGSVERAKYDSSYEEISNIFLDDLPVTFLFPFVNFTAATRRLKGYSALESGGTTDFDVMGDIHKYWLEERPSE